jgi:hypothetical protein
MFVHPLLLVRIQEEGMQAFCRTELEVLKLASDLS